MRRLGIGSLIGLAMLAGAGGAAHAAPNNAGKKPNTRNVDGDQSSSRITEKFASTSCAT